MKFSASSEDHTTNQQNCTEYPVRLLKFVLKKLKIRELFSKHVQDPRSRVDNYNLTFLLMHGLLTHLFRSPSKHKFHLHLLRPGASAAVAKLNGNQDRCPCTRTLDDVLINLDPDDFQPILPAIFRSLCRGKVFQLHPEFIPQNEYAITIDAQVIHTYNEPSQHPCQSCPYCLKRTRGDKTWYLHCDLVASFVAPNGLQIPLLFHRIHARPEWGRLGEERWKQEDLFNDLQHRGFAISHDFNRAPAAQLVRTYLILIAYAICSILAHSALGKSILSTGMTISFMMEQMLMDLIYVPEMVLFKWRGHGQLRWGTDPPKIAKQTTL
jgi:hypothetical protein